MPTSAISGESPIQFAWLAVVLPSLALNYLGQGALVLANPKAIENPFFLLYPEWALLPMVALATAATVIASQAVITGAYSLTRQAIQLGLLPRFEIRHTSETQIGQIYMPRVNALLLLGVLLLVALFRSSSALASAYGIAVTGTMVVTATMAIVVIRQGLALAAVGRGRADRAVPADRRDLPRRQPPEGRRGRLDAAGARRAGDDGDVHLAARQPAAVREDPQERGAARSAGCVAGAQAAAARARHRGVPHQRSHLCADRDDAQPQALQGAAREATSSSPSKPLKSRASIPPSGCRSSRSARPSSACGCASASWNSPTCRRRSPLPAGRAASSTSCRRRSSCRGERCRPAAHSGMPRWQDRLFIGLARSANDATDYFQIPTERVVEVGTQVAI